MRIPSSAGVPKRLSVLWITPWFPCRLHSTLGNFIKRHAEVAAQHSGVFVIHFYKNDKNTSEVEHFTVEGYAGVHFYYGAGVPGKLQLVYFILKQLVIKARATDVVHLNIFHETYWTVFLIKWLTRKPVVCTEHWTGYHNGNFDKLPLWKQKLMKWAAALVDEFQPVSQHLGKAMQSALGLDLPIYIIPNVVNTDVFKPLHNVEKKYDFIHLSTLDFTHKRPDAILRQFSKVLYSYPSATLAMGGDGDITSLTHVAEQLGISRSVTFFGELTPEEVSVFFNKSRCLVLYSSYENFPCVIPEAWSCGIPVIASDVGGIREWLTEAQGFLVDPADEHQLADAMVNFLKKSEKFSSASLRAYSSTYFSYASVSDRFLKRYLLLMQ